MNSIHSFFQHSEYKDLDALFISTPANIAFCVSFFGSFSRVILTKTGKTILLSDSRYSKSAQELCDANGYIYKEISHDKTFWETFCKEFEIETMGIESENITLSQWSLLKKSFSNIQLQETKGIIEKLRTEKTEKEIALLRQAAHIGDKALQYTVSHFREGITEKEIAWIFEKYAKEELKVSELSFDIIVAFGENSAVAHHSPSSKKLNQKKPILIDCGVKYKNYCSDLTRCFWFGEQTGEEFQEWKKTYELVHQAQKKGIALMKPGNVIAESEKAARKIFGDNAKNFGHSFGHGVGIDIHELPYVSSKNTLQTYSENMVVTAEPGLYFPNKFGIRIEDLLVIRKDGAEFLSQYEYEV